jgi:hypothetical protein
LLQQLRCTIFVNMSEYHIGEAMKAFLNKSNLKNGVRAVQIENVWTDLMGKTIAKYTDKIQIINSTLFITTSIGPLKHELLFQKDKIIQRVNEAFGENIIKEVVIQ